MDCGRDENDKKICHEWVDYSVAEIFKHKNFNNETYNNDIMVIKTNSSIIYDSKLNLIKTTKFPAVCFRIHQASSFAPHGRPR